jgi:type IV pilus assembly protein PilO
MSVLAKLPKKTQLYILGALMLAMVGIFYQYMISPLRADLGVLDAEIIRLRSEVEAGQVVRQQLAAIKQGVAKQIEELNQLKQILPERKETAAVIRQVHQMAVDSRLRIKSFTPQATINNGFYEDWPILIAMEGNFYTLGYFFEKIGKFQRLINVGNISVQALGEDATQATSIKATCTATTFVYVEPQTTDEEESE